MRKREQSVEGHWRDEVCSLDNVPGDLARRVQEESY